MIDHEALLKELLATFEQEAQEHIGALSSLLLALERENEAGKRKCLVESIFRRMHTLKGAAHAVNLPDIAHACQELEDVLADLKRGDLALDLALFDRLHGDIDVLAARICKVMEPSANVQATGAAAPEPPPRVPSPAASAAATAAGVPPEGSRLPGNRTYTPPKQSPVSEKELHPVPPVRSQGDETVRVSTKLLEALLLQSEELVSAKLAASVLHEEVAAVSAELSGRQEARARSLDAARKALRGATADGRQAGLAALLEQSCQKERHAEGRLRLLEKSAEKHLRSLQGMIDPLLEEMKKLQLLPCSSLLDPFAKQVRDVARELGKEAELTCRGAELEIDRRILAELKEPLLHLVRNTVDHGIETPEERRLKEKPAKGSLNVEVRLQDANRAELVLSDDGCGIDLARVKQAALGLELAPPEALERMPDHEALQLIFESGISTSRIIGSISGRGIGLAIVRESLERLGGHVTVTSSPGEGAVFRLSFPLSFARMRGLLVQVAGRDCVIPAANVELSARVPAARIKRVENLDTVLVNGEVISLVSLPRILELEQGAADPDAMQPYVLLHAADRRIAFAVDRVAGVQEILVKPLGHQLSRVRNVSGATVLGTGRVVPVLNVADLFRSALQGGASFAPLPSAAPAAKPGRISVLVAEDSITSRTLLKNILESSGYLVRTAVDGVDALSQLKTESCDIVVSDVEMPRMDGFQLTSAIRADSRFASLPVILVTGLESRSDRERGIDAGASAYLVKSSFDQSSLIEVIQKLT